MCAKTGTFLTTLIVLLTTFTCFVHSSEDFCASNYGIQLCTGWTMAGALDYLTYRGHQYIDQQDHGREWQVRLSNGSGLCYYIVEAGAQFDTSSSSSKLLAVNNSIPGTLQTSAQPAYYLAPGNSNGCNPAVNTVQLSNYIIHKNVQIGFDGYTNALLFTFDIFVPENQPIFQVDLAAFMPVDFKNFFSIDLNSGVTTSLGISTTNQFGTSNYPNLVTTDDHNNTLGAFPYLVPAGGSMSYNQAYFGAGAGSTGKWSIIWSGSAAAGTTLNFGILACIGTFAEVQDCMTQKALELNFVGNPRSCTTKNGITMCTNPRTAAAVDSLVVNNVQYINSINQGRELQVTVDSGASSCSLAEEGGSINDGPSSTSQVFRSSAANGVISTSSRPAIWNPCPNGPQVSNFLIDKTVQIGVDEFPHAILYQFNVSVTDASLSMIIESPVIYLPSTFDNFWSILPDGTLGVVNLGTESFNPTVTGTDGSSALYSSVVLSSPPGNVSYVAISYAGDTTRLSALWRGRAAAGSVLSFSSLICVGNSMARDILPCISALSARYGTPGPCIANGYGVELCAPPASTGVISSLTYRGQEYIDSSEHRKNMLIRVDGLDQNCGSASEFGLLSDNVAFTSSSQLISSSTVQGLTLTTATYPALGYAPYPPPAGCNFGSIKSTDIVFNKTVRGLAGFTNAIMYSFDVSFKNSVSNMNINSPLSFLRPEFTSFYTLDLANRQAYTHNGNDVSAQAGPVVAATSDSSKAIGSFLVNAPTSNIVYLGYYNLIVNLWNGAAAPGASLHFDAVICVGTVSEVEACLYNAAQQLGYVGAPTAAPTTTAPTTVVPTTQLPTTTAPTTVVPTTQLPTTLQPTTTVPTTTVPTTTVPTTTVPTTTVPTTTVPTTVTPTAPAVSTSSSSTSAVAATTTLTSGAATLSSATSALAKATATFSTITSAVSVSSTSSASQAATSSSSLAKVSTSSSTLSASSSTSAMKSTSTSSTLAASSSSAVVVSSSSTSNKLATSTSTSNKVATSSSTVATSSSSTIMGTTTTSFSSATNTLSVGAANYASSASTFSTATNSMATATQTGTSSSSASVKQTSSSSASSASTTTA